MMIIIGRFSEEKATVNEDAKTRGKDWTRLPMPLCHWSFRFLDLRSLSSMSSRSLCQIYQRTTRRKIIERLILMDELVRRSLAYFCVDLMKSRRQINRKLGHVVQMAVCCLP